MPIERTVIGSFPPFSQPYSPENVIKAITNIVDLQLRYGIDVITDGEQRGSMIEYFEQIPGLERTKKGLKIVGKIKPMDNPDSFYKISDYRYVKSYLTSQGKENVKIKITITGPVTLCFSSAMEDLVSTKKYYKDLRNPEIYSDFSEVLSSLARRAIDIGAYLQIDEPGLSGGFIQPELGKEILNRFFSSLPKSAIAEGKVSMHVCGSISSRLYSQLLGLDMGILSLGFSGKEESANIDVISRKSLEDNHKKLGAGFISNKVVEDEKTALERLKQIAQIVGPENIAYVHPTCGFRSTSPELVEPILKNMKIASDDFIKSLFQV